MSSTIKIDEIDERLLALLQADAKMNIKQIATELGLTKTPVYERIKRLEQAGIIDKYVAIVDKEKLSTNMVVFCTVSLESQRIEELESFNKAIEKIPEVMECYLLGGIGDYLLKVIVRDLSDYHQFSSGKLARLDNVSKIKSSFVLNEVKSSTVLPIQSFSY